MHLHREWQGCREPPCSHAPAMGQRALITGPLSAGGVRCSQNVCPAGRAQGSHVSAIICWLVGSEPQTLLSRLCPFFPRFMEFEEEEMQTQKRTWMQGKLCKLPPGPLPLVPQGPPATVAVQQPGKASPFTTQPMKKATGTKCLHNHPRGKFLSRATCLLFPAEGTTACPGS